MDVRNVGTYLTVYFQDKILLAKFHPRISFHGQVMKPWVMWLVMGMLGVIVMGSTNLEINLSCDFSKYKLIVLSFSAAKKIEGNWAQLCKPGWLQREL